jgi:predicted RNA binding protein YcfA (HicA-like mRNA interferase family)
MPPLPSVSGREAVRAFEKAGYTFQRQRGSHFMLVKPGAPTTLAVPNHRPVRPGTLRTLIRQAGLTVEEFIALL